MKLVLVLKAGLEKTRFFFKKNQPNGFFGVFLVILGVFFWGGGLGFFAQKRGFLGFFFQFQEYFILYKIFYVEFLFHSKAKRDDTTVH